MFAAAARSSSFSPGTRWPLSVLAPAGGGGALKATAVAVRDRMDLVEAPQQPGASMFYDRELHIFPSQCRNFATQVTSRACLFTAFCLMNMPVAASALSSNAFECDGNAP